MSPPKSVPKPEETLENVMERIERKGRVKPVARTTQQPHPLLAVGLTLTTLIALLAAGIIIFRGKLFGATPTSVYQPTITLSQPMESTPTSQQYNTPVPLLSHYTIIPLQSYSVFTSPATSLGLPVGNQTLLNIPFEIGWGLKTPCTSDPNVPAQYTINTNLEGITRLDFLIQGGWAVTDYASKGIGDIVLNFSNGASYTTPLVVGDNIRDWSTGNPTAITTISDPSVQEAWTGQDVNGNGRMDVLSLALPQEYANLTLTSIVLTDTSSTTLGSVNPCFYVNAITAETNQPATQQPTPANLSVASPLLPQLQANIGTGVFQDASYSDGSAPYTEEWLRANHPDIQRIRAEEQPSGCDISRYDTNLIWFGSAEPNFLSINDKIIIGYLEAATGKHGYIITYPVKIGDKLCVSKVPAAGYQIVIGTDLYWHYDSYCYRGNC